MPKASQCKFRSCLQSVASRIDLRREQLGPTRSRGRLDPLVRFGQILRGSGTAPLPERCAGNCWLRLLESALGPKPVEGRGAEPPNESRMSDFPLALAI